jgi:hypothetical protein
MTAALTAIGRKDEHPSNSAKEPGDVHAPAHLRRDRGI